MIVIKNLLRDTRGNVATITAVVSMVLILGTGAVLDYGRASSVRQNLQNTSDIGVLAAAAAFHRDTSLSDGELKKIARDAVRNNCAVVFCGDSWKTKVNIADSEVTVDIESASPNVIMAMTGKDAVPVSSRSVAGLIGTTGAWVDLYIIADMSGSMNIPDSPAEISRLMTSHRLWSYGCAFACHVQMETSVPTGLSIARNLNLYLREDRVKDEVLNFGTRMLNAGDGKLTLNVIPYTSSIKDRYLDIKTKTALNDVMRDFPTTSDGTLAYQILPNIAEELPQSGTGMTQSDPIVSVLLITDGVDQSPTNSQDAAPIDPAICDPLKAKADTLFVLNVIYPHPDTTNPDRSHDRTNQVRTIYDDIKPNIQACASDGAYYEGEFGDDIAEAFTELTGEVGGGLYKEVRLVR